MPIRPEMRSLYPRDWPQISKSLREGRANNQCEGSPRYPDCRAANGEPHPVTGSKVVLTVAHLDHNPANCDLDNLRVMCQRCHLTYDADERGVTLGQRIADLNARNLGPAKGGTNVKNVDNFLPEVQIAAIDTGEPPLSNNIMFVGLEEGYRWGWGKTRSHIFRVQNDRSFARTICGWKAGKYADYCGDPPRCQRCVRSWKLRGEPDIEGYHTLTMFGASEASVVVPMAQEGGDTDAVPIRSSEEVDVGQRPKEGREMGEGNPQGQEAPKEAVQAQEQEQEIAPTPSTSVPQNVVTTTEAIGFEARQLHLVDYTYVWGEEGVGDRVWCVGYCGKDERQVRDADRMGIYIQDVFGHIVFHDFGEANEEVYTLEQVALEVCITCLQGYRFNRLMKGKKGGDTNGRQAIQGDTQGQAIRGQQAQEVVPVVAYLD
jgi:hypothetical protein